MLIFAVHQFVATIGVIVFTAFIAFQLLPNISFLQGKMNRSLHWILTETPYFPLQIAIAGLLGYLICSTKLRHFALLWVWLLPLLWIAAAFFNLIPTTADVVVKSRIAHFFGWGCQPRLHCFDQLTFTLPFYTSLAYSTGALLSKLIKRNI